MSGLAQPHQGRRGAHEPGQGNVERAPAEGIPRQGRGGVRQGLHGPGQLGEPAVEHADLLYVRVSARELEHLGAGREDGCTAALADGEGDDISRSPPVGEGTVVQDGHRQTHAVDDCFACALAQAVAERSGREVADVDSVCIGAGLVEGECARENARDVVVAKGGEHDRACGAGVGIMAPM
ncbi:hypothetical protein [Tsukamurella soli]|uniref:hypothetical protein n=1 Tax=Tsukamurella soli TaxID=644556 RepID=UPI0036232B44